MKKVLYVVLSIAMLFTLNSCDWFNTTFLGKPSKAEVTKRQLLERVRQDSLAQVDQQLALEAEQAALDAQRTQEDAERLATDSKRYHVVVGCFRVPSNAERMLNTLQSRGYNQKAMHFKNGFTCISAASYDDIHAAYNEMNRVLRTDFAPEDVWVYDTTFALHTN